MRHFFILLKLLFFSRFHNVDTFQHGGCGLPSEFLRSCQGVIVCEKIFSDESYRPEPFSDEEFCHDRHMLEASLYYVRKHNQLPDKTSRILEQVIVRYSGLRYLNGGRLVWRCSESLLERKVMVQFLPVTSGMMLL